MLAKQVYHTACRISYRVSDISLNIRQGTVLCLSCPLLLFRKIDKIKGRFFGLYIKTENVIVYLDRNGILFKKQFEDGINIAFNIVSNKKRSLNLITAYMDKADYKKRSLPKLC